MSQSQIVLIPSILFFDYRHTHSFLIASPIRVQPKHSILIHMRRWKSSQQTRTNNRMSLPKTRLKTTLLVYNSIFRSCKIVLKNVVAKIGCSFRSCALQYKTYYNPKVQIKSLFLLSQLDFLTTLNTHSLRGAPKK